jgi:hypothetical protein
MKLLDKASQVLKAFLASAIVGGITFAVVLLALRPLAPISLFNQTIPELYLATGIAFVFSAILFWRVVEDGSSVSEEFKKFFDAITNSDNNN